MRQGRRVDQGALSAARQALYRIDEGTFVVGLKPLDLDVEGAGRLLHHVLDLSEAGPPVDLRLPLPQQVEIGAVEYRDAHSALQVLQPGLELVEVVFSW